MLNRKRPRVRTPRSNCAGAQIFAQGLAGLLDAPVPDLTEIHCEAIVLNHNGITVTTHLLLAEQRTPGEPMRPFPLRMPSSQLDRLNAHAERLRCYPAALARALVCRGMDQIESELA